MTIKTIIIKFDRKNEDEIVKKKNINTTNSNKKNRDIIWKIKKLDNNFNFIYY
jgi:hypothetical protein